MSTFQDYLNDKENREYSEKQLKIIDKIILSEDTVSKIKGIEKNIKILAVAEVYCPDCRAIVAFLEKFAQLNDKIKIEYSTRDESGELLLKASGQKRIPTLFLDDGINVQLLLVEFPQSVQQEMKESPDRFDEIKYNFRIGKYNEEIESELLGYLLSV